MACVDCGATGTPLGAHQGIHLERCKRCKLVFLSDWSEDFNEELYDYYADRINWTEPKLFSDLNATRHVELLNFLGNRVSGQRLLDVGCGTGGLVRTAGHTGWAARGIDLSQSAIEICRKYQLDCSVTDFFDPSLESETFDVIVMSELIEHVPHPRRFLIRASQLLSVGGLLYVTTPNWNSFDRFVLRNNWSAIDPEHLSYFSPRTLRGTASVSGMRVENLWTENVSLAALRRLFLRPVLPNDSNLRADEQQFRAAIASSPTKSLAKSTVNSVLRRLGAGASMKAIMRASRTQV